MTSRASVRPNQAFLKDQSGRDYYLLDFQIKGEKRKEKIPISNEDSVTVVSN